MPLLEYFKLLWADGERERKFFFFESFVFEKVLPTAHYTTHSGDLNIVGGVFFFYIDTSCCTLFTI